MKIINTIKNKNVNKKAELPFWLVIMIVSLIFGFIVIIIFSGGVKDFLKSTTSIKEKTTAKQECLVPINSPLSIDQDQDGLADGKSYTDESGKEVSCDPDFG